MYVGQRRGGSRLLCIAQWPCSKPGQRTAARLHQAPVKPMGRHGNETCCPQLSARWRGRADLLSAGPQDRCSSAPGLWVQGPGLHVRRGATLERCLAAATGAELVDGVHCARCSLRACLAAAAGAPAAAPMRAASKAPRPLVQPAAGGERRVAAAPPAPPCSPALPAPLRPAESSGCVAGDALSPRGGACAACGCAGRRASCTDRRCLADPAAALQAGGPQRAGAAAMPALHQHPADAPGGVRRRGTGSCQRMRRLRRHGGRRGGCGRRVWGRVPGPGGAGERAGAAAGGGRARGRDGGRPGRALAPAACARAPARSAGTRAAGSLPAPSSA